MTLDGKYAIVTGANKGIGFAVARRFVLAGAHVALVGKNLTLIEEACKRIKDEIPMAKVIPVEIDLRNAECVIKEIQKLYEIWSSIDILVNNAGICRLTEEFSAVEDSMWEETLQVNLYGAVRMIRAVIPKMKEQRNGKIVQIASLAAETGGLSTAVDYVSSKAAVIGMTKSLAKELGVYQINVNAVAPGFVNTDMTKNMLIDVKNIPLQKIAQPEDIAEAVLFLASESSRCITGTTLDVNAGIYMN